MTPEFSQHNLEKLSNIKFHENPSTGIRVVPCGRTDMTKLRVALRKVYERAQKCTQSLSDRLKHFQCVMFIHVWMGITFHTVVRSRGISICFADDCRCAIRHTGTKASEEAAAAYNLKDIPLVYLKITKHIYPWRRCVTDKASNYTK